MPRLLYLCIHPRDRSPSQRYRFEQFEPLLRERGFAIDYSSALTEADLPTFVGNSSAVTKGAVAMRALRRRLNSVIPSFGRPRFDVVLVQKEAFFLFNAWSEWLAQLQAPMVLDFDDAIWIRVTSAANRRFEAFKSVAKVKQCASLATSVIAGNSFLGDWARQYNSSVTVIPTSVNTHRYVSSGRRADAPITIGWCGSPSTIPHLRTILPALERVKARFGNRVQLRVMGDPSFRHEPLQLFGEAWNSQAELTFLQQMHIGLMPLPDDEWSKGKCGLKALTSMACAAATVVSPVGVNSSIVSNGANGLLACTIDEWFESISRLVEDSALRERLGTAGRETVVSRFSTERWQEAFFGVLMNAVEVGRR